MARWPKYLAAGLILASVGYFFVGQVRHGNLPSIPTLLIGAFGGSSVDHLDTQETTLRKRAEAHDVDAQFELAVMLLEKVRHNSLSDPEWISEGCYWLEIAAQNGNAMAQNELGVIAEGGLYERPQDVTVAIRWYQAATDGGDEYAPFNLGRIYRNGKDVPRNEGKATLYFDLSRERGHLPAVFEMGLRYREGLGIEKSADRAQRLFEEARQNQFNIEEFYRSELAYKEDSAVSIGIASILKQRATSYDSWARLSYEYALALAEKEKLNKSEVRAVFGLDDMESLFLGLFADGMNWADPVLHTRMFAVAASLGNQDAQLAYAERLESGVGVSINALEATYWRQRAKRNAAG